MKTMSNGCDYELKIFVKNYYVMTSCTRSNYVRITSPRQKRETTGSLMICLLLMRSSHSFTRLLHWLIKRCLIHNDRFSHEAFAVIHSSWYLFIYDNDVRYVHLCVFFPRCVNRCSTSGSLSLSVSLLLYSPSLLLLIQLSDWDLYVCFESACVVLCS